jgi:hypothetical protein
MSEKKYLYQEWNPEHPVTTWCEEDGCVVNFSPDASTRVFWCKQADGDTLHEHEGWYWVYCSALEGYTRICRVD